MENYDNYYCSFTRINLFPADVVHPGFFQDYFITDDVTGLPHDSAQGYMFDFYYNLLIVRYLHHVNELEADELETVLKFTSSGLNKS